jgi:hypothetical protein
VHRTFDGSDQRLIELAKILALGVSRLNLAGQGAEPKPSGESPRLYPDSRESLGICALTPLERSRATGVTVGRAVNGGESEVLEPVGAQIEQEYSTWL